MRIIKKINTGLVNAIFAFIALFVMLFTHASCDLIPTESGSIRVSAENAVSRTIAPDISMDVARYEIDGRGPGEAQFNGHFLPGETFLAESLLFGTWTVELTALNEANDVIGRGSSDCEVRSNETTVLIVEVLPIEGTGTLDLSFAWNPSLIDMPELRASLIPVSGETIDLDVVLDAPQGNATYRSDFASGYYTLILQLLDNGALTTGLVEVVRVVDSQVSSADIVFENINMPGGSIDINVDLALADPIQLTLENQPTFMLSGDTVVYEPEVSNYADNLIFTWYVDGRAVDNAEQFSMNGTWGAGYHRLSVTVFTPDGLRAGSAQHAVYVSAQSGSTEDLSDRLVLGGSNYYVDDQNRLWGWGGNRDGQMLRPAGEDLAIPTVIMSDVAKVWSSGYHTGILKTDGSFWTAGYNYHGELGDGTRNSSSTAINVMNNVADASLSGSRTMIITDSGEAYGTGYNYHGQLGDGTNINRTGFVHVMSGVTKIESTAVTTLFLKADGSAWGCGANSSAQLGDGFTASVYSTPFLIETGIADIAIGWSGFLLRTDGTLLASGVNHYGEIMSGDTDQYLTYTELLQNVAEIESGGNYSYVRFTDGRVIAAGYNFQRELGTGGRTHRVEPVTIGTGIVDIIPGEYASAVQTADGQILVFGSVQNGPDFNRQDYSPLPEAFSLY